MSSNTELQEEEKEVLLSIYEGDEAFKELTPTTYQYKYGEDNDPQSFLLEISWNSNYPTEKPTINMDTFYNKHISQVVKDKVIAHVEAEAEQWLGCAMTYTLFQSVGENVSQLFVDQPSAIEEVTEKLHITDLAESLCQDDVSKKTKKEQLTKAQKRRKWNQADGKGEKPRGWNWIDLVKHLSQTGSAKDQES